MATELENNKGKLILGTSYMPPRRNYFPNPDLMKVLRTNKPAYIAADLNSRLNNQATHMGPEFRTWIGPQGTGTPDIVLGNQNMRMNCSITQGPLASSDHIPVIIRLSTKAITIPKRPTLSYQKSNGEKFQRAVETNMTHLTPQILSEVINKDYVDQEIDQRYNDVQDAIQKEIPVSNRKTIAHLRTSRKQNELQWRYKNSIDIVNYLGWTPILRQQYINIQEKLTKESKKVYNKYWNSLIEKKEIDRKDPTKFWKGMGRLLGSNQDETPYILGNNNTRL